MLIVLGPPGFTSWWVCSRERERVSWFQRDKCWRNTRRQSRFETRYLITHSDMQTATEIPDSSQRAVSSPLKWEFRPPKWVWVLPCRYAYSRNLQTKGGTDTDGCPNKVQHIQPILRFFSNVLWESFLRKKSDFFFLRGIILLSLWPKRTSVPLLQNWGCCHEEYNHTVAQHSLFKWLTKLIYAAADPSITCRNLELPHRYLPKSLICLAVLWVLKLI